MVAFIAAGLFDGLMDTAGDMAFVLRIMAFAYITYWLFVTFNENMTIFGLTTIITGYFLLFHSPIILIVAIIVLLVIFGSQLQMSIQFGLLSPMQQIHQEEQMEMQEASARLQQQAAMKLQQGIAFDQLSFEEQQAAAVMMQQEQMQHGYQNPYGNSRRMQ